MDANQIHADADQMHDFAAVLAQFAQRVNDFNATLARELDRLGNTFGGPDYVQFRADFQSTRQILTRFVEETRKIVPELKKDADVIADFQRIKLNK